MSTSLQNDNHGSFLHGALTPGSSVIALPHAANPTTDPVTGAVYAQQVFVLADKAGNNLALVAADGSQLMSSGGAKTAPVAAAAAASAIKTGAGRLCRVLVTTLGTAGLNFYDNATSATGTIIGAIPASAAVGSVYDFSMPASNGIWCASGTNTPAVTVSYI